MRLKPRNGALVPEQPDQSELDEFRVTAAWLRAHRPTMSPLEDDALQRRVASRLQAAPASRGLRSRAAALISAATLMVGLGTAFSIAGKAPPSGSTGANRSAAEAQYKPGKGCGDKNHQHERENECKKPPK